MMYMIKGDIRIKEIEHYFCSSFHFIYKNDISPCIDNAKDLLIWYKEEVDKRKIERERVNLREICHSLIEKNAEEEFADDI